jgi:hypothetical protein
VKKWGEQADLPKSPCSMEVVELDEMHTYLGSKKTTGGYGLLLIDLGKGSSLLSAGTGQPKRG